METRTIVITPNVRGITCIGTIAVDEIETSLNMPMPTNDLTGFKNELLPDKEQIFKNYDQISNKSAEIQKIIEERDKSEWRALQTNKFLLMLLCIVSSVLLTLKIVRHCKTNVRNGFFSRKNNSYANQESSSLITDIELNN